MNVPPTFTATNPHHESVDPLGGVAGGQKPSDLIDSSVNVTNPGSYEELHKKTKEVFPIIYEGFKFTLNKMLSTHFQVNHSITMSSIVPSAYKFGATYVGTSQLSPSEVNLKCII